MEHRVAEAGDHGTAQEHEVIAGRGQRERGENEQGKAGEQHAARVDPVHQEAGERLSDARYHEKHRHQQAKLRVRQAECRFQPREQRREDQVKEVGNAMREGDQANDKGILAQVSVLHAVPDVVWPGGSVAKTGERGADTSQFPAPPTPRRSHLRQHMDTLPNACLHPFV